MPASVSGVAEDLIIHFIGDMRALLVLDSFEHLLESAPLVAHLLAVCPNLHVLVTNQTVLRLTGEHSLVIGPLPLPRSDASSLKSVEAAGAPTLFLDQARAIRADFGRREDDASSIAEIVRRLDGLPLAIVIAA